MSEGLSAKRLNPRLTGMQPLSEGLCGRKGYMEEGAFVICKLSDSSNTILGKLSFLWVGKRDWRIFCYIFAD